MNQKQHLQKANKSARLVIIIVVVLVVALAVLLAANRGSIVDKNIAQETATISILQEGVQVATVRMEDVLAMPAESFRSQERSSGDRSQMLYYTGALLRDLLAYYDITVADEETVVVRGADGYTIALTAAEVASDGNAYLTYALDGQSLGTKKSGGRGPYQLVICDDTFAQRWCKYVMEIEIK